MRCIKYAGQVLGPEQVQSGAAAAMRQLELCNLPSCCLVLCSPHASVLTVPTPQRQHTAAAANAPPPPVIVPVLVQTSPRALCQSSRPYALAPSPPPPPPPHARAQPATASTRTRRSWHASPSQQALLEDVVARAKVVAAAKASLTARRQVRLIQQQRQPAGLLAVQRHGQQALLRRGRRVRSSRQHASACGDGRQLRACRGWRRRGRRVRCMHRMPRRAQARSALAPAPAGAAAGPGAGCRPRGPPCRSAAPAHSSARARMREAWMMQPRHARQAAAAAADHGV